MIKKGLLLSLVIALCVLLGTELVRRGQESPSDLKQPVVRNPLDSAPEASISDEGALATVILTGDGGEIDEGVLNTLVRHLSGAPHTTTAYLMGDNIYMAGLFPEGHPKRDESYGRLMRQVNPLKATGARIVFVPGNHDWADPGDAQDGLEAVRREESTIVAELGEGSFAPLRGCPGPLVVQDDIVRVIAIDTEWFLRETNRPYGPDSGCSSSTEGEFKKNLELLLRTDSSKPTILVQHHPLESSGPHGVGANCMQDFGCRKYREMREMFFSVLNSYHPLLCAAGHDHILEFLTGDKGCEFYMVSGSLSYPKTPKGSPRSLFSYQGFGFFRMDIFSPEKIRVQAIGAAKGSLNGKVLYEGWLRGHG